MSSNDSSAGIWLDFQEKRQRAQRQQKRRMPKPIGDVLDELIVRRGYGRLQANDQLQQAWCTAAGATLSQFSELGPLRRGTLEVVVANSTLMQEFAFAKQNILDALQHELPEMAIQDLRFRVGAVRRSD